MVSRSHASRRQPRTRPILALLVATLVVSPALVATTAAPPAAANGIQLFTIGTCNVPGTPANWVGNITPTPSVTIGATPTWPAPPLETAFGGGAGVYFNRGSIPAAWMNVGGEVSVAFPSDCRDGLGPAIRHEGGYGWELSDDGRTLTAIRSTTEEFEVALPDGITATITADVAVLNGPTPFEVTLKRTGSNATVLSLRGEGRDGPSARTNLFQVGGEFSSTRSDPPPSGPSTSSAPSPADQAVSVAVEQAAGISGASSVLIRDGQPVPVTTTIAAGVGPRGGAVIEAEGLRVTVDGGRGASATSGVAAVVGGEIVCEVCAALAAGSVIEAWVYSTPQLAAAVLVEEDLEDGECPLLRIPLGAPLTGDPVEAGAHTLQLRMYTEDGFEVVATGITVGGAVPSAVPAGEGPGPSALPLGVLALLAGAFGATVLRRRAVAVRG